MKIDPFLQFEKDFLKLTERINRQSESGGIGYLNDYIRAYSSKGHLYDVYRDLDLVHKYLEGRDIILDFGCGMGFQSIFLANMGYRVIGVETVSDKSIEGFFKININSHERDRISTLFQNWNLLKSEKVGLDYEFYDGKRLPFKNASFDSVLAYAVLEHIPKDEIPAILESISMVLKPGGFLFVFQLPQKYSYTEFTARKLGWQSHPFLWTMPEILALLLSRGFDILEAKRTGLLFNQPYALANRLFPVIRWFNQTFAFPPISFIAHHINVVGRRRDG